MRHLLIRSIDLFVSGLVRLEQNLDLGISQERTFDIMKRLGKSGKKTRKPQVRSALTKNKMLEVAIEAFAHKGYEGVGTREIADRAGTNLSSIRYHFGDKKSLYRAVIQHISDGLHQRISAYVDQVRSRAEEPGVSKEELITLLCHLITSFTSQLLASGIPDTWARLIVSEQVNPTDAFPILYEVLRLLTEGAALVVSKLIGEDPRAERVRISTMTILGQALVFRTHRQTSTRFIGWKSIGSRELATLQSIISDQCRAIILSQSERALQSHRSGPGAFRQHGAPGRTKRRDI